LSLEYRLLQRPACHVTINRLFPKSFVDSEKEIEDQATSAYMTYAIFFRSQHPRSQPVHLESVAACSERAIVVVMHNDKRVEVHFEERLYVGQVVDRRVRHGVWTVQCINCAVERETYASHVFERDGLLLRWIELEIVLACEAALQLCDATLQNLRALVVDFFFDLPA